MFQISGKRHVLWYYSLLRGTELFAWKAQVSSTRYNRRSLPIPPSIEDRSSLQILSLEGRGRQERVKLCDREGVIDKDNSIRTAPGRLPAPGMGLLKYTVGTPAVIITMDYIMIWDKKQARFYNSTEYRVPPIQAFEGRLRSECGVLDLFSVLYAVDGYIAVKRVILEDGDP